MHNRRSFISRIAAAGVAAGSSAVAATTKSARRTSTFLELIRVPDRARAFAGLENGFDLQQQSTEFAARDVVVSFEVAGKRCSITVAAPKTELTHLQLRWNCKVDPNLLFLGDHWERSYGDLAWRGATAERVMPWYFATYDQQSVHCYGVQTGPAALCFWTADLEGVSLWLDLRNGGGGVLLGGRRLHAATVVTRRGSPHESPVSALREFCKQMCAQPVLPQGPIYGANDWYYAYGNNSQEMLLRMTDLVAEVSPAGGTRPFTVVDMGWKDGSPEFPSMAKFADEVRKRNTRPGIWMRPLEAPLETAEGLLLPAKRYGSRSERYKELAYDPTIPEALEPVRKKMRAAVDWNFDLVKHDFSTYDLFGQWGFEMGAQPTIPGWNFHDRSRTNAEIVLDFYKFLRETLGSKMLILGCNTIGHLSAGIFELQRTGDDTSGRIWERTRRMGVNTLAYRLPQHETFFVMDADCVAITSAIPWEQTKLWLDLVTQSRTALFISPEESATGAEQRAALKDSFGKLTSPGHAAEPQDFFHTTTPEVWRSGEAVKRYPWCAQQGAWPFVV